MSALGGKLPLALALLPRHSCMRLCEHNQTELTRSATVSHFSKLTHFVSRLQIALLRVGGKVRFFENPPFGSFAPPGTVRTSSLPRHTSRMT